MTADRPSDNALQAAEIVVEQRHRDAAAEYFATIAPAMPNIVQNAKKEPSALARAFARFEAALRTDTQATKEERAAFEQQYKHLDLTRVINCWGVPEYQHSHVGALWEGWSMRSALPATPSPVTDETALSGEAGKRENWPGERVEEVKNTLNKWSVLGRSEREQIAEEIVDRLDAIVLASTPQPAVAEGWRIYTIDASIEGRWRVMLVGPDRDYAADPADPDSIAHRGPQYVCEVGSSLSTAIAACNAAIRQGQTAGEGR